MAHTTWESGGKLERRKGFLVANFSLKPGVNDVVVSWASRNDESDDHVPSSKTLL